MMAKWWLARRGAAPRAPGHPLVCPVLPHVQVLMCWVLCGGNTARALPAPDALLHGKGLMARWAAAQALMDGAASAQEEEGDL